MVFNIKNANSYIIGSILLILSGFFYSSCLKEEVFSSNLPIHFSSDTLSFDTVFTTLGSTTQFVKLYNPSNEGIQIDRIYLAGGNSSHFRLNLNGKSGLSFEGIHIRPNDSIYLFCEVTINPNDPLELSPFVILDSVIAENSTGIKVLTLEAYGQNANYYPSKANQRNIVGIDLQGQTLVWNDPKPYIIYGIVYLDNGTLQIEAGSRIHFFGGLASFKDTSGRTIFYNDGRLIIGPKASLKVNGTSNQRVLMTGVRLESSYQKIPGQWSGIALDQFSKGNSIKYADIRNSLLGLQMDSLSECHVSQCIFSHQTYSGISALAADLTLENSLFFDQGQQALSFQNGGNLVAAYNTFVSLGNDESAVFLSNIYCADPPFCEDIRLHPLNADLTNCIITGSNQDEFWMVIDQMERVAFNLKMNNSLLRIKELLFPNNYPDFIRVHTIDCIFQSSLDSLFRDLNMDDYRLDSLSIAEKKALPISSLNFDLTGFLRDPVQPDLGCYEYEK